MTTESKPKSCPHLWVHSYVRVRGQVTKRCLLCKVIEREEVSQSSA